MANFQLRSMSGDVYILNTSNPELLAKWLLEHIGKVCQPPYMDRAELVVYPGGRDVANGQWEPDWPFERVNQWYMNRDELECVRRVFDDIVAKRNLTLRGTTESAA